MRRQLLLLVPMLGGIALSACGGETAPSAPASAAVTIKNFAFGPSSLTVSPGTKVTWTNTDTSVHTVTAVDGSFDSGNLAQNQTFSHTFATAGTVMYRCNIHQYMTATVVVK